MRKGMRLMLLILVLSLMVYGRGESGLKNVIIMISDGCGYNHILATNYYQYGKAEAQVYEEFHIRMGMSTNSLDGNEYDSEKAWSDFEWVMDGYTDSAAAATAISTGVKTHNGVLGKDARGEDLQHLSERAAELGKSCGVVTSVPFSHATPAGFVAHNMSRNNYEEIAIEMLNNDKLQIIMGCGNPLYDNNGKLRENGGKYKYVGGAEFWQSWQSETSRVIIQKKTGFMDLINNGSSGLVLGMPEIYKSLQYNRKGSGELPFVTGYVEEIPSLQEMTRGALKVLGTNDNGLFLMVEGGAVDWASHNNNIVRMIEEQIEFNYAVEEVVLWIEEHSHWQETLLIVTADHECGYLTGAGSNPEWKEIKNNGRGVLPDVQWNSGHHTNSLVPFYAEGYGDELFKKSAHNSDSVRGSYIDNTAIASNIRWMWRTR